MSRKPFILAFCVVLDTAAGVWCDTKSVVTTPRTGRYSADAAGGDAAVELTRRCRHAASAVGDLIFIYGGLRGGKTRYIQQNCDINNLFEIMTFSFVPPAVVIVIIIC